MARSKAMSFQFKGWKIVLHSMMLFFELRFGEILDFGWSVPTHFVVFQVGCGELVHDTHTNKENKMINGNMVCAFQPGSYCGRNQIEADKKYDELKHIITKLNLPNWVNVEYKDVPNPATGLPIHMIIVTVPNNTNFWFQLTQLPKMLIPYFWKLSDEELEKKRMELLTNDAWGVEHLKQLALKICGGILTMESYDSCATGNYKYSIGLDDESSASVHFTGDDGVLNHAEALRNEITLVKSVANALTTNGDKIEKICTENYWGMFK